MRRLGIVIVAALIAALSVGLVTSASAGNDGSATAAAGKKKKKKKCPAGTIKKVVVKKNGKRKRTCVPQPTSPTPGTTGTTAQLTVSPTSFTFSSVQHGQQTPPQAFTVTNTGTASSGTPSPALIELTQPVMGDHGPGYVISANSCGGALAPGGTCSVSVVFAPPSNAGDGRYTSNLEVTASPGNTAVSGLSGETSD